MTILATILSLRGDKALRVKKSGEDYILTVYQLKGDRFYPQIGLMVSPEEYEKIYIQKNEEM